MSETTQAPPRRSSSFQAFLMIAALVASCAVGGYYLWAGSRGSSRMADTGFDVAHVDAPAPVAASNYAPAAPKASPMPIAGMPGLQTSPVPEKSDSSAGQFQKGAAPSGGAAAPAGPQVDQDEAKHEKEFLQRYGAVVTAYHHRVLDTIAMRHYKSDPTVRRVDAQFASLPRYMAIKRQFDKDHDPFAFARGALALPEVRQQIAKMAADTSVWKAALGMVTEALHNPPPKAVYDEAKRFMVKSEDVSGYMANEFLPLARQNTGAIQGAIDQHTDIQALQKLATDVMPGAGGGGLTGMPPDVMKQMQQAQAPKR